MPEDTTVVAMLFVILRVVGRPVAVAVQLTSELEEQHLLIVS
jgi:hypothetical protein